MFTNITHIVGDNFIEFAKNNFDVITISAFDQLARSHCLSNNTLYIPGQGLSENQLTNLMHMLKEENKQLVQAIQSVDKAKSAFTHKHHEKNIMISKPVQVRNDKYEANLLVDGSCAEMSDHMTGQHIQGIVLVEAARQLFIAITEEHFLSQEKNRFYFVPSKIETSFKAFAMPLQTQMHYHILESNIKKGAVYDFLVRVDFAQSGQVICEVTVKFSAYNQIFLVAKEAAAAKSAVLATRAVVIEQAQRIFNN